MIISNNDKENCKTSEHYVKKCLVCCLLDIDRGIKRLTNIIS